MVVVQLLLLLLSHRQFTGEHDQVAVLILHGSLIHQVRFPLVCQPQIQRLIETASPLALGMVI